MNRFKFSSLIFFIFICSNTLDVSMRYMCMRMRVYFIPSVNCHLSDKLTATHVRFLFITTIATIITLRMRCFCWDIIFGNRKKLFLFTSWLLVVQQETSIKFKFLIWTFFLSIYGLCLLVFPSLSEFGLSLRCYDYIRNGHKCRQMSAIQKQTILILYKGNSYIRISAFNFNKTKTHFNAVFFFFFIILVCCYRCGCLVSATSNSFVDKHHENVTKHFFVQPKKRPII